MTGPNDQGNILVADDNSVNLILLAEILTAAGYQVRPANSGELALASVAASPPELILLDMRMPFMDGFAVCRQLKARSESCNIPILFISASTEIAERVEGLKMGAVDFISKPFQPAELLARIKTHLELSRLRASLEKQALSLQKANALLQDEIAERKKVEAEREQLIDDLENALQQVKTLSGLLPICAGCKKIRDDQNKWHSVESYIMDHSQAEFSHGLCPDCIKIYFPN